MKKRLIIAFALLLLLSTYKTQKLFSIEIFNIKEIKIENNFILSKIIIKKNLAFLYDSNLFFLNTSNIEKKLKKIALIESYQVKKIYPNKLRIKIFEKKPIAVLQYNKKKFYISENYNLFDYIDLANYRNLPEVFGNKDNFKTFHKNLKKINFPLDIIKKYYFYEAKRWDLEIYEKKVIKLPTQNYIKSLENFMNISKKNNFKIYNTFDYRINNQLILK
jgi:cell division protein FtsQ|tara:strand:- start:2587 stop:3243 length:657 start_codon:yes stop_codon:yes gene_type:complete